MSFEITFGFDEADKVVIDCILGIHMRCEYIGTNMFDCQTLQKMGYIISHLIHDVTYAVHNERLSLTAFTIGLNISVYFIHMLITV